MTDIDEATYKKEKEDFVSNLSGSSLEEILLVILVVPVTTLFQRSLMKRFESLRVENRSTLFQFMFDYITTIVPIVVSCTFTYATFVMYFFMLGSTIFNFATAKRAKTPKSTASHHVPAESKDDKDRLKLLNSPKKPYLNTYRSGMMILTCIAILAVDFRIFPRAYAKTETYGISLMDVGVGCFIVSGALVSKKARSAIESSTNKARVESPRLTPKKPGSPRMERHRKEKMSEQPANETEQIVTPVSSPQLSRAQVPQTGLQRLKSALKAMTLLLGVGLVRFTIIKVFNYQEHVTEYGEHWNFFLTLAFVGLVTVVLDMDVHLTGVFGFLLLVAYQVLLTHVGVEQYILDAPRTNFFNQNREGIISLFGYLGLYFMSVELGYWVNKNKSKNGWWIFAGALAVLSFFAWILCSFVQIHFGVPSSRRMANMPYSLLVLTINFHILALCLGVDLITLPKPNLILSSVSATRNSQLLVFLLANIMTGIVNLSMRTLYATPLTSFLVLCGYSWLVSFVSVFILPLLPF
jgi:phosphatidylinositol glycan class W